MCSRLRNSKNDGIRYTLQGDVYNDYLPSEFQTNTQLNFSSTLLNKSSSTSSISSNTAISEIEDKPIDKIKKNVEIQKDEISEEKRVKIKKTPKTENTEYNLCDMIDETNSDILAFLTEMYTHEECDPDIHDLLEDTVYHDFTKSPKKPDGKIKNQCFCDCHTQKEKREKVTQNDSKINHIKAPAGTNITIPIYAAAAMPQNPQNNIIWPPNGQLYQNPVSYPNCRDSHQIMCQPYGNHCKHHSNMHPHCRRFPKICPNQNNRNFSNHNHFSDTLNFNTQFDDDISCKHSKQNKEKDFYKSLIGNRMNRVGSPLNWNEIMGYLD